jgi:hypothetical protein
MSSLGVARKGRFYRKFAVFPSEKMQQCLRLGVGYVVQEVGWNAFDTGILPTSDDPGRERLRACGRLGKVQRELIVSMS